MRRLLFATLLLGATFALAGELQRLHQSQTATQAPSRPATKPAKAPPGTMAFPTQTPAAPVRPAHDITTIGLERTRCYGQCPAYTVMIERGGQFRYVGEYGVEHIGSYTGQVERGRLAQVMDFIAETDFMAMAPSYLSGFLDGPTAYTMVSQGGETKVVENYANSGPATLWAIEQLIDSLLETAEWTPADR